MHGAISQGTTNNEIISDRPQSFPWYRMPYLCSHVLVAGGTDERKANQKYVRLWVRKWTESIIILLTCSIPKAKGNGLAIHHHIGRIIVENWPLNVRYVTCIVSDDRPVGIYSP